MSEEPYPPTSQIDRHAMFEPLLRADPAFLATWQAFQDEWCHDEKETPQYLALGDLARYLIVQLEAGKTECFDAIFDVVEAWHVKGDSYVREAATVGLIEDLQNENLYKAAKTAKPEDFKRWLRPVSARYWAHVEAFWTTGKPIPGDG